MSLTVAAFPNLRLRRLRQSASVRELFQENHLNPSDLIWPIFVCESGDDTEIATMPGVRRYLVDELPEQVEEACQLGIRAILLFPKTPSALKTENAIEALNPQNLICQAIRKIKECVPKMVVLTDVALDPYTTHGHDGILKNGDVENDVTIDVLIKQTLNQVEAGSDGICPSDMMDGRIQLFMGHFAEPLGRICRGIKKLTSLILLMRLKLCATLNKTLPKVQMP